MNANNDLSFHHCMPLKEWSLLIYNREKAQIQQTLEDEQSSDSEIGVRFQIEKTLRQRCVWAIAHIAQKLVNFLAQREDDVMYDSVPTNLQPNDISMENFVVRFKLNDVKSLEPGPHSAAEVIERFSQDEISEILDNGVVSFSSPVGGQRGRINSHERLESVYFRRLGELFFNLFLPPFARNAPVPSDGVDNEQNDHEQPDDEEKPGADKGRRKYTPGGANKLVKLSTFGVLDNLQEHFLPTSICRLVADLMEEGLHAHDSFQTLQDVQLELNQITENTNRLICEENSCKNINFRDDLTFGRSNEISTLLNAIVASQVQSRLFLNSVILIGGEPGSGKSHLLQNMQEPLSRNGWLCLKCKFDILSRNLSSSTVFSAFDEFFQSLSRMRSTSEGAEALQELVLLIEHQIPAAGIATLSQVIPSFRSLFPDVFRRVVPNDDGDEEIEEDEGIMLLQHSIDHSEEDSIPADTIKHRLHYFFERLIHAISSPERPVLLFLDDLQWADNASLDLISSFVMKSHFNVMEDENMHPHCFVVAGTYRSNEVDDDHLLLAHIRDFMSADTVRLTHINVSGVDGEGTKAMISYALQLPIRLTRELSEIVHAKTLGNPLFIKEFLNSLQAEGLMYYSQKEKRWLWDIESISTRPVDDDVAAIMTRKVLRMPPDVLYALTVAACFGRRVDENILKVLCSSDQFGGVIEILQRVETDGIIQRQGTYFVFAHDLVHQAVYDLIDVDEVGELHYNIGVQLVKDISPSNFPTGKESFVAIDQINKASSSVYFTDLSFRNHLATLNLKAGERLIETAESSSALVYLQHGIRHLGRDGWEENYELCLKLYESACQACYLNGFVNRVVFYAEEIDKHTTDFMRRVKAVWILIQTLGSSGKPEMAIEKAFSALRELGEEFPEGVTEADIFSTLSSTKALLSTYTIEMILNAPKLRDERKQWAIKIMDNISPFLFQINPVYLPIFGCRTVHISLSHGFCRDSWFGFLSYAHSVVSILADIDEGYRWAKIAGFIIDRFNAKSLLPRFKCVINGGVNFWKEPLQSTASALTESSKEAIAIGDVEYVMYGSSLSCVQNLLCGNKLSTLEKDIAVTVSGMVRMNQAYFLFSQLSLQKAVYTLTGIKNDPFEIKFASMKNETDVISAFSATRPFLVQGVYFNIIFTAVLFRRFDEVSEVAEKYLSFGQQKSRLQDLFLVFFQGLAAFHMFRHQGRDAKWLRIGESSMRQLQLWAGHSTWNFDNKFFLLEAESHFSKGEYDHAEMKYLSAIKSARTHRFLHEEGLSLELLSSFYEACEREDDQRNHLSRAIQCYKEWGALGLLNDSRFAGLV
eukprot:CAMPEP_0171357828 /NCGR_PEP_ID=MMETSP0878-20121228/46434_1 /TAXON_ID=67004 /ORGANISM="Thalassiosira weissflogii, Strain CCMP1336" /LENGTH=1324 /DNA_ID=CAMNT_0011863881 /DNA_START=50 /DNA_END=4024 /DNA_ORIENTATION=+